MKQFGPTAGIAIARLLLYRQQSRPNPLYLQPGLLQRLSGIKTIRAVKRPLPADGDLAGELAVLRERTSFAIGNSSDWGAARPPQHEVLKVSNDRPRTSLSLPHFRLAPEKPSARSQLNSRTHLA
jgi:hypothetical protein